MGKMNELSAILDSTVECGNSLIKAANALKDFYSSTEDAKEVKEEVVASVEPEKTYSMEEVRAILSAKSKAGYREQVKALITKRGVDNLTKLDPSEYASLVKEVEELANG